MLTETLVDVGGYHLALRRGGDGTPAVVLEAGAGGGASIWEPVQRAVAAFTEVCAFDRPGIGRSDPAPPRSPRRRIVDDVHTLLRNAPVPPPYILVGHSSGGLNMRMYALCYPDDVAGMVLVDAVHPDQFIRAEALLPSEVPDEDASLHEFRDALRALNQSQAEAPKNDGPDEPPLDVGTIASLGAVPLIVLTATQHDLGLPDPVAAPLEQDWQAMQQEMVGLSSDSVQIIVDGCGHNIHVERPDLVVDAIRRVVDAARRRIPLR